MSVCIHCEKKTKRFHPILDIPLCLVCQKARPELYRWICKTTVLKDYLVNETALKVLDYYEVPNPYSVNAPPMKLFLVQQVEAKFGAPTCDHSARNGRDHQGTVYTSFRRHIVKAA